MGCASGVRNSANAGQSATDAEDSGHGWAIQIAGARASDGVSAIAVDDAGYIYATGKSEDTADFDPSDGELWLEGNAAFLMKLTPDADLVWAVKLGEWTDTKDIEIDGAGNIYVCGNLNNQEPSDFDPGPGEDLHSATYTDSMVCKFDGDGNYIWGRSWGSDGNDWCTGVAVDGSGNVYVTGTVEDGHPVDFDPGPGEHIVVIEEYLDIYLNMLDADGDFVRAIAWDGVSEDFSGDVECDGSGNIYVCGTWSQGVDFDLNPSTIRQNLGYKYGAIVKLDSSLNYQWVIPVGTWGYDIEISDSGDIFVAGSVIWHELNPESTEEKWLEAFLCSVTPDGNKRWMKTWGGENVDRGIRVAIGPDGDPVIAGTCAGLVDLDPGPGETAYTKDRSEQWVFVSGFGADGSFSWGHLLPGSGNENYGGFGLAVCGSGSVYAGGGFHGDEEFAPLTDECEVASHIMSTHETWSPNYDGYIVRYLPDGCW